MKKPNEEAIIEISKKVAIASTGIGTLILGGYLITQEDMLMPVGLMYISIAGIINGFFVVLLIIECLCKITHWRKYVTTIIFMLANIPLSILYCYIASI